MAIQKHSEEKWSSQGGCYAVYVIIRWCVYNTIPYATTLVTNHGFWLAHMGVSAILSIPLKFNHGLRLAHIFSKFHHSSEKLWPLTLDYAKFICDMTFNSRIKRKKEKNGQQLIYQCIWFKCPSLKPAAPLLHLLHMRNVFCVCKKSRL